MLNTDMEDPIDKTKLLQEVSGDMRHIVYLLEALNLEVKKLMELMESVCDE